ncbi:MAG: PEP-CTERM sorting domain-containing protein [Planctomycetes bacterium]|nr:PEP-CTERM sorting domain-containing protein [Planctomycetota bacterium]
MMTKLVLPRAVEGLLISIILLLCSPCFATFVYDPITEPITSATFSADFAALVAHRNLFGYEVNFAKLYDPTGSLGMYDLSDDLFGTAAYPAVPLVNMGDLETGIVSVAIDPSFFPALAGGSIGLDFLFTDTDDSMFAIDFVSLTIQTDAATIESYFGWPVGDENNGFGIGLADGEDLPSILPVAIPIDATGTGYDETLSSKSHTPEPTSIALLGCSALGLFLRRKRSRRQTKTKKYTHSNLILLLLAAIILPTLLPSNVQAEKVGNFVPDSITLSNVSYHNDTFAYSGNFGFELENEPNTGVSYLNVILDWNEDGSVDPCEWVIQNIPFANSDFNDSTHSVYFQLDSEQLSANAYVDLNDVELAPPSGTLEPFFDVFLGVSFDIQLLAESGQDGNAPPPGPPATSPDQLPKGRQGMPDIPQYANECGPTSTANSIIWLAKRGKWVNKLLKAAGRPEDGKIDPSDSNKPQDHTTDEDEIIKKLLEEMQPGAANDPNFGGLTGNQLEEGKIEFISKNKLPLVVHGGNDDPNANGAKMLDFIKKEIDKKQDVEMLVFWPTFPDPCDPNKTIGGGGHWVTVVDISIKGEDVIVTVVDPDDKKGTAKKPHLAKWKAKKNGGFTDPNCMAGWAVAESPEKRIDNVHVYPIENPLAPDFPVGPIGVVTASVQFEFAGVTDIDVEFIKRQGNFTFNNGTILPDGSETTITTDSNGIAEAQITGDANGLVLIEVTVNNSVQPTAFLFFNIIDCPFVADLDGDCDVDFDDFAVFALAWCADNTPTANWNPACDISDLPDGIIDAKDLDVFSNEWLAGK